jgi:hypothetical protein
MIFLKRIPAYLAGKEVNSGEKGTLSGTFSPIAP